MTAKNALIIFGPTASGKTSLGINLAQELNGVIINADSRQIYQEMPIITAMPTAEEFDAAEHLLFDFLKPGEPFSVDQYIGKAKEAISNVTARGKLPIFVGGTGFYLKVLTDGISPVPPIPPVLVESLTAQAETEGTPSLHAQLQKVDPVLAKRLEANDMQRVIRGLAVYQHTKKTLSSYQQLPAEKPFPDINFIKIALIPPRETLYKRIHDRFDVMVQDGVLEEAKMLYDKGYRFDNQALTSLGLKELFHYLDGKIDLETAKEKTLQQMRNYAKRQTTWLRNQYHAKITLEDGKNGDFAMKEVKKLLK